MTRRARVFAALLGAIGPPDGVGALVGELLVRALAPELWWMVVCARTLGGVGWVVPGLVGLVCAGVLWPAARHRTARVNDVLLERAVPLPAPRQLSILTGELADLLDWHGSATSPAGLQRSSRVPKLEGEVQA